MAGLADTLDAMRRLREGFVERGDASSTSQMDDLNPGNLGSALHVPPDLPGNSPLVVVLHGCTQSALGYARGAGWLDLADRAGFAVLCPEQKRQNNPNLCFNWFQVGDTIRGSGEARSISAMVSQTVSEYQIDAKRVFVTGLSAGGAMTAVMLATYPEMFAGGAVIAGLPYGAARNVQQAFAAMQRGSGMSAESLAGTVRSGSLHEAEWPTLSIWHGTNDMTVTHQAADELAQQWSGIHRTLPNPSEIRSLSGRPYLVWKTPSGRSVVELHKIDRMGHGTPIDSRGVERCGKPGPFFLDVGVPSTVEIATSWGIANARVAGQVLERGSVSGHPDIIIPEISHAAPALAPALGIAETINSALRKAGLLR